MNRRNPINKAASPATESQVFSLIDYDMVRLEKGYTQFTHKVLLFSIGLCLILFAWAIAIHKTTNYPLAFLFVTGFVSTILGFGINKVALLRYLEVDLQHLKLWRKLKKKLKVSPYFNKVFNLIVEMNANDENLKVITMTIPFIFLQKHYEDLLRIEYEIHRRRRLWVEAGLPFLSSSTR